MGAMEECAVHTGPAGWSYQDWKGRVYPEDLPAKTHALSFLCRRFDAIEINASFYRPPDPRHCARWIEETAANPRFVFSAKLWQRFTHDRSRDWGEKEVNLFRASLAPLYEAGRLRAVLLQFPWRFRRSRENRVYLARLADAFAFWPLAVELRHKTWDTEEVYEGLRERGIAFCNIDQPVIGDSIAPSETITAPLAYARFHGRNYRDWFREDAGRDNRYNYLYSEEELKPWIGRLRRMKKQSREMLIITNNHYRGQAVLNALEIQQAVNSGEDRFSEARQQCYARMKKLLRGEAGE
jgi:uncharacterized protein YecE (DUF72 family)